MKSPEENIRLLKEIADNAINDLYKIADTNICEVCDQTDCESCNGAGSRFKWRGDCSEVKFPYGYWIPIWFDNEDKEMGEPPSDYKCSCCENIVSRAEYMYNYCPYCGVPMEGMIADG